MTTLCRDYRPADPPVLVAWPTNTVSLEDKFHNAVLSAKFQKIKELVARGVNVDCFNEDGQTALFCASFKGLTEVVSLLLSLGAKPNARCQPEGYTAVHGACYSGSTAILKLLIQAGGDLRICDHKRRTPKAWSLLQPDSVKVHAIHNVIESARLCTTETSGLEMLKEMQISLSPRTSNALGEVVRNIFRKSVVNSRSKTGVQINMDELRNGIHHTGFGKVYFGVGERCASVIGVPYISEVSDLEEEKDDSVPSWSCGKFTSFNPKIWTSRKTQVSTRELNAKAGPHCVPDILINELEIRGKLHHPNLLMLLGVCQTDHCEAISLVYERVNIGSLYSVLHIDQKQLTPKFATDVIIQMCDALEYVHSMKMIHCGVSSHAVMLVSNGVAKLSCFEYCLPENTHSQASMTQRHPILTSDAHLNVLRHWMAPEVLLRQQFSVRSDVYSLCCVMWELCNLDLPWTTFTLQNLRQLYSTNPNELLPISKSKVPQLWYHLLSLGLTARKDQRDLEIAEIKDMMLLSRRPKAIHGSRGSLFGSLRRSVVSASGIPAQPEPEPELEAEDGLDVVDVADYFAPNGQMYRATSMSSLPERIPPAGHEFKSTSTTSLWGKNSASGDYFKVSERMKPEDSGSDEDLMQLETKKESNKFENVNMEHQNEMPKVQQQQPQGQPQGILKKFGFNTKSKSSVAVQSLPTETVNTGEKIREDESKPDKGTQTEIERLEEDVLSRPSQGDDSDSGVRIVKPKKIGAILSLGMGWTKPFSNSEKKCKSVQTEAVSLRLGKRLPAGLSSPSPVHSPTSSSTPVWHSFNSSREPLDIVVDPEIKAARNHLKEKLTKILEMRQAGDFPRSFSSLKLPKKASSSIKPASHSIEGVTSAATGSTNEFLNYLASVSLVSHSCAAAATGGVKVGAPAIKPAGHAMSLDRSGRVVVQKSRSHLDLPAAVPEEMVQSGFVFETVDKFNAYARGMPLDFQRQRIPWDQAQVERFNRIDGGDGRVVPPNDDGAFLDGAANPFQRSSQSVGIQCELSPMRHILKDVSSIVDPSMRGHSEEPMQTADLGDRLRKTSSDSSGSASGNGNSQEESGPEEGQAVATSRRNSDVDTHDQTIHSDDSDDAGTGSGTSSSCVDFSDSVVEDRNQEIIVLTEPASGASDVPCTDNYFPGSLTAPDEIEDDVGSHSVLYSTALASPKPAEVRSHPSDSSVDSHGPGGDEEPLLSPRARSGLSLLQEPSPSPHTSSESHNVEDDDNPGNNPEADQFANNNNNDEPQPENQRPVEEND